MHSFLGDVIKNRTEREHALGLNSPEIVKDLNDLGRVTFAQMKYQQAIAYYERVVQIMETSKGRSDMALAVPLDKLTRTSQALEKHSQAEQYARRALAVIEKNKSGRLAMGTQYAASNSLLRGKPRCVGKAQRRRELLQARPTEVEAARETRLVTLGVLREPDAPTILPLKAAPVPSAQVSS